MTLDSLIAVIALLFTVYQVIPRYRQLELHIRFGWIELSVIIAALIIILYLQLYSFFAVIGLTPGYNLSRFNLTPERASFFVLLSGVFLLGLLFTFRPVAPGKIFQLRQLIDELMYEKKYTEVVSLLDINLPRILAISGNLTLPSKIKKRYKLKKADEQNSSEELLASIRAMLGEKVKLLEEPLDETTALVSRKSPAERLADKVGTAALEAAQPLLKLIPDYETEQEVARNILDNLLYSDEFAVMVALQRPLFGLNLIQLERVFQNSGFFNKYTETMLLNPESPLFKEIKNNQWKVDGFYELPATNRLLSFFFGDAARAEKLSVWSPVGETVINELERLNQITDDPYNLPSDRLFEERQMDVSPLFGGVFLFELMVESALRQGVEWHMWLYYFTHFMERIARNYSPNSPAYDPASEFPTRYSKLIYRIFSILINWIKAAEKLPRDQKNIKFTNKSVSPENSSIPQSSLIVLFQCLEILLKSKRIEERFKMDTLEQIYLLYFDLEDNWKELAQVMLLKLNFSFEDPLLRALFQDGFNKMDMPRYGLKVDRLRKKLRRISKLRAAGGNIPA